MHLHEGDRARTLDDGKYEGGLIRLNNVLAHSEDSKGGTPSSATVLELL